VIYNRYIIDSSLLNSRLRTVSN